jgi:hypothetical protein
MDIQAPYDAGSPGPIFVGGDADAGGRDTVAGTVEGAVSNALARAAECASDTYAQGSQLGDSITLVANPPPFEEPYFPETNQNVPGRPS